MKKRKTPLLLIVLNLFYLVSCDKAFLYRPVGWTAVDGDYQWAKVFPEVTIRTHGLIDFIGSSEIGVSLDISNSSTREIVLAQALLGGKAGTFRAVLPADGEAKWRMVPAGGTASIFIRFNFDQNVLDALGPNPELLLKFDAAEDTFSLQVGYERIE